MLSLTKLALLFSSIVILEDNISNFLDNVSFSFLSILELVSNTFKSLSIWSNCSLINKILSCNFISLESYLLLSEIRFFSPDNLSTFALILTNSCCLLYNFSFKSFILVFNSSIVASFVDVLDKVSAILSFSISICLLAPLYSLLYSSISLTTNAISLDSNSFLSFK